MLNELLHEFMVLVVSDQPELANLFEAIATACGATVTKAATVPDAVQALHQRPHVALIDVVFEDPAWTVSVAASTLRVPVVALTHRCADPYHVSGPVNALAARVLHSTELEEVCKVVHLATSEGP